MSESSKAPVFRGHVRKSVSPQGVDCWVSEVRTAGEFTPLGLAHTVSEAIALAIKKAYTPAPVAAQASTQAQVQPEPLRQAA